MLVTRARVARLRGAFLALLCAWPGLGSSPASAQNDDSVPPPRATAPKAPPSSNTAAEAPSGGERTADDVLVVATKPAPPFVVLKEDGEWTGISITLWETVAERLDLDYRFEESSLADMVDGVADGRFDASIAALTITRAREREVDFSHPFHTTGYAIVVPRDASDWTQMTKRLFSLDFFRAIALLVLLLTFVGFCFWLAERRKNAAEFRPGLAGLGDGFWFSAVTMTTTGYGDMAPRTFAGRLVGLVWMFSALIITSTFIGMIASSLTAERLALRVEGPSDLAALVTGSVGGSASDDWLASRGLGFEPYASVDDGLDALERGDIDAFVYDRPLLQYLLRHSRGDALQLVPGEFGRQDYGIALPPGSPLREPLNRVLLHHVDSAIWDSTLRRWFGPLE